MQTSRTVPRFSGYGPFVFSAGARRTVLLLWITYGAFYLCRVNIGPARADLQLAAGLSAADMGVVLGALKVGYAFGQLVHGQWVERVNPVRVAFFGAVVSALLNVALVLVGIGARPFLVTLLWGANGFAQAAGWPATVKILSQWFGVSERGRVMGLMGTSYQVGSALTLLGSGALVSLFGVRAAFLVPAALLLIVAVAVTRHVASSPEAKPSEGRTAHSMLALGGLLRNARIWMLAWGLFGLDIVRYGFLDWATGHLRDVTGSSTLVSSLKICVFPLSGALGALASGAISERYFGSRRGPVLVLFLSSLAVSTLLYRGVAPLGTSAIVVALALSGFSLYGAQIVLVGTAAQDFAEKRAGAAAGFIDCFGYLGAFFGDVVTGLLLSRSGWHAAITFWAVSAALAAVVSLPLWRARPASS